jgi:exodeoxyribonuclease VII large subunit
VSEDPLDFFLSAPAEPTARVEEPRVLTIAEVTRAIRSVVEGAFNEVWVQGEVSNYRQQASGHQYFTLKDAESQLACVLFARPGLWRKATPLQDGMHVQAKGRITVYEARGQYQLNVSTVQAAGAGLLQAKFEALKRKLAGEGLFDAENKREIPEFPRGVGIVTSPTGAALRDMLNIFARRAPWLPVVISPARVQGEGAAAEIIAALEQVNEMAARGTTPIDVIVLARGGGSIEDLWQFNDEALARAIAGSPLPVVSAIGHEIDFTIADFVADLRAPTPSAAAELVAPDTATLLRQIEQRGVALQRCLTQALSAARIRVTSLARSALFREPAQRLEQFTQRVDSAEQSLGHHVARRRSELQERLAEAAAHLRQHRPDQMLAIIRGQLSALAAKAEDRFHRHLQARRERLQRAADKLRLLAPETILKRGYSLTTDATGRLVRSVQDAAPGAILTTTLPDGVVTSIVSEASAAPPKASKAPRKRKA